MALKHIRVNYYNIEMTSINTVDPLYTTAFVQKHYDVKLNLLLYKIHILNNKAIQNLCISKCHYKEFSCCNECHFKDG